MTFQSVKRFRGCIAALAMFVSLTPTAMAQEFTDAHLSAARAAIAAINATDPYDNILPVAAERLKTLMIQNNLDLETEISQTVDEQILALASRRGDLEDEAARIYAAAFTQEELQAIADFYGTEAGKKMLQNGPIVVREVANAAGIWQRGIERDLRINVSKVLSDAGLREPTPAPESAETPAAGATPAEGQATQN